MVFLTTSTNSSFGPNEPLDTVIRERTIIIEEIFNGCGWGVTFVLYWQAISILLNRRREHWFLSIYATSLFTIGTLYLIVVIFLTCKMFIDDRNIPGGPSQAIVAVYSQSIIMLGNACFPLQSWLSDGLMIYRCLIIYGHNYYVILFPCILLLGSVVTSSTLLGFEAHPDVGFWSPISIKLAIPYFSLSISINIIVTALIVIRLLLHRKTIKAALGKEHARHYTSITAMLVESAALNTGCSLIFLILYARNNPASNVFQGLVVYCQITASMLIVLRVAKGYAFSKGTITITYPPVSSLRFNPPKSNGESGHNDSTDVESKSMIVVAPSTDIGSTTLSSNTYGRGKRVGTRDIEIEFEDGNGSCTSVSNPDKIV